LLGVKVIDTDTGDFVVELFNVNFLLRNIVVGVLGLFQKVG